MDHLSAIFPVIGDGQNDNRKLIENIFDKAKIHVNFADKNEVQKIILFVCKMYYEQVLIIIHVLILARVNTSDGILPLNRATASGWAYYIVS